MYELKTNEKATPVMIYTESTLIHGKIVTKDFVRVNIFLRTEGAPNYLHLLDAHIIRLGSTVKTMKFDEIYVPIGEIVGFHVAPGIEIELDYEENEANRRMVDMKALLGSCEMSCKIRISTQSDLVNFLETTRSKWLSLYEASNTNPYLPQMKTQAPMLLVRPERTSFGSVLM